MPNETRTTSPRLLALCALTAVLFVIACKAIAEAPREITMGLVQKIFYFHVPCAWLLMLSTLVCAGGWLA